MNTSREEPRQAGPALALALCALCLSGLPARARAAGNDEAGARVLFAEGRRFAAAGNYAEACPKFEDSFRLDPGIGTSFNLADCLEHTGRTASAWARFLDVAAATKAAGQLERERVARARALALEPRLSRLMVEVSSPAPGLVVTRDGIVLGAAARGSAVPVDPGDHLVEATAPGRRKWSENASVPDAPTTVTVVVPALEALPPDQPALAAPMTPLPASDLSSIPRGERPRRLTASVVALGALGAVALATGAVFALEVQSENGDAKKLCPNGICGTHDEKANHDHLVADAYRDEKVAFISAGIGAVALLAGAYRWWRPASAGSPKDTAARLSARPLAGALGARLEVDWVITRGMHVLLSLGLVALVTRCSIDDRKLRVRGDCVTPPAGGLISDFSAARPQLCPAGVCPGLGAAPSVYTPVGETQGLIFPYRSVVSQVIALSLTTSGSPPYAGQALRAVMDSGAPSTDASIAHDGFAFEVVDCIDTSTFSGVTFTTAGNLGSCSFRFAVQFRAADAGTFGPLCPIDECFASDSVPVGAGMTTLTFSGGGGSAVLTGMQWEFDIPSAPPGGCTADFTIDDIRLISEP